MLARPIRSYLVPIELPDAPRNCYREILSEHNLWKFTGLLCRTVYHNPHGNWRMLLGHDLLLGVRPELSSAGVFTASWFTLIYQEFSKSVTLLVCIANLRFYKYSAVKNMGRKRYFIQGDAVWERLQELWKKDVAVLTPLAIKCLSCSRLQRVPQLMCGSYSKSSDLPHFPPAVRVFCDWFLWAD